MKWKHVLRMIAGCTLPLLFIFLAPLLGIKGNWSVFIFVAAMFACHIFMPMHHHHSEESKKSNHEQHSH